LCSRVLGMLPCQRDPLRHCVVCPDVAGISLAGSARFADNSPSFFSVNLRSFPLKKFYSEAPESLKSLQFNPFHLEKMFINSSKLVKFIENPINVRKYEINFVRFLFKSSSN
jgi:hypothetical protein